MCEDQQLEPFGGSGVEIGTWVALRETKKSVDKGTLIWLQVSVLSVAHSIWKQIGPFCNELKGTSKRCGTMQWEVNPMTVYQVEELWALGLWMFWGPIKCHKVNLGWQWKTGESWAIKISSRFAILPRSLKISRGRSGSRWLPTFKRPVNAYPFSDLPHDTSYIHSHCHTLSIACPLSPNHFLDRSPVHVEP